MAEVQHEDNMHMELAPVVHFDVLSSTYIKRKKPWSRLALLGERVYLFDQQRISVLYMETGKTKRKVPKLHNLVSEAVVVTQSSNGAYIGGLLLDGNLFLWHKNNDRVKHISGLPQFAINISLAPDKQSLPYLSIADNGFAILLVTATREIFVWETDVSEPFSNKIVGIPGTWSSVVLSDVNPLPNESCQELAIHAVFASPDFALGSVCVCSFVYLVGSDVRVATLLLKWFDLQDVYSSRCPTFSANWQINAFHLSSLGPLTQPVPEKGAFVIRHSRDGQLLVIAVNQLNSHCNKLVYVAPFSAVISVNDLRGMGTRLPITQNPRSYWIKDMEWTNDGLFIACINGQGSVCLLPRLGDPLLIQTQGHGIEMGPKYFLPLHPLVSIHGRNSTDEVHDPMRQRFSVAVHPSLQILLFSDGYMVTAVELSDCGQFFTCLSFVRILLESADARLQRGFYLGHWLWSSLLNKSVTDDSSSGRHRKLTGDGSEEGSRLRTKFKFETTPPDAGDEAEGLDEPNFGYEFGDATSGRVSFGDSENMMKTGEFHDARLDSVFDEDYDFVSVSSKELMLAWGIMATYSQPWTVEHETAAGNIVSGFIQMFSAIINNEERSGLQRVLIFYRRFLEMASVDSLGQNLLVASMDFVRQTVELLLRAKSLRKSSCMSLLHGVLLAIRFAEKHLAQTYTIMVPSTRRINNLPYDSLQASERDIYSFPTIFGAIGLHKKLKRQDLAFSSMASRLAGCWQLLYSYAKRYYEAMYRHSTRQSSETKKKRVSRRKVVQTTNLLSAINGRLQHLNIDLEFQQSNGVTSGETLYIEGDTDSAIRSWLNFIEKMPEDQLDSGVVSRVLHSILYAQLQLYRLSEALSLVDIVCQLRDIRQVATEYNNPDSRKSTVLQLNNWNMNQSNSSSPPIITRTKAARRLMRSLGRVMALYFADQTVFIFPAHHPLLMPALHSAQHNGNRVMKLNRDLMMDAICNDHLDAVWTPKKALEYLLLSGLIPDAVWLVGQLGDWKAQLIMAVTVHYHCEVSSKNHLSERQNSQLPESLQPKSLARDHVLASIEDCLNCELTDSATIHSVTSFVADKLLICLMSGLDAVCILIERLSAQLMETVKQFQCFVPDGIHLPAPPVYCQQPVITNEERQLLNCDQLAELECRHRVAIIVTKIIIILRASKCFDPLASWFAAKVVRAYRLGMKLQKEKDDGHLNEDHVQMFQQYSVTKSLLIGHESDSSVSSLLTSFRDLCSVIWMLDNRDALSLALKQKECEFHNQLNRVSQSTSSQWSAQCSSAFKLAKNLLPFTAFMHTEREIHSVLLTLIMELRRDHHAAALLADVFPDMKLVNPEAQGKLRWILKEWQGIFVTDEDDDQRVVENDSVERKRGKTLALLYHNLTCQHQQLLDQKFKVFGSYEASVFAPDDVTEEAKLMVGSRPFESCVEFVKLLDTFYSVTFSDELNSSSDARVAQLPVVSTFMQEVRRQELRSVFDLAPNIQRNISINQNPDYLRIPPPTPKPYAIPNLANEPVRQISKKLTGLFRSRSVTYLDESLGFAKQSSMQSKTADRMGSSSPTYELGETFSPKNTNNNNVRRNRSVEEFGRSTSLVDFRNHEPAVDTSNTRSERHSESVLSDAAIKNVKFSGDYVLSEKMAEWMNTYTSKRAVGNWSKPTALSAAISVRVSAKMLTYALWLLDNSSYVLPCANDLIVAVATQSGKSSFKEQKVSFPRVQDVVVAAAAGSSLSPMLPTRRSSQIIDKNSIPTTIKKKKKSKVHQVEEIQVQEDALEDYHEMKRTKRIVGSVSGKLNASMPVTNQKKEKNKSKVHQVEEIQVQEDAFEEYNERKRTKRIGSVQEKNNSKVIQVEEKQVQEDALEEYYEMKGTKRVAAGSGVLNAANVDDAEPSVSSDYSLSVSSHLDDEDENRQFHEELKETLARISRPVSMRLDDIDNQKQEHSSTIDKSLQNTETSPERLVTRTYPSEPQNNVQQAAAAVAAATAGAAGDAFNLNNFGQDLVGQLQRAVREEMRRIMEVQHQGILAVLNVLDDGAETTGAQQLQVHPELVGKAPHRARSSPVMKIQLQEAFNGTVSSIRPQQQDSRAGKKPVITLQDTKQQKEEQQVTPRTDSSGSNSVLCISAKDEDNTIDVSVTPLSMSRFSDGTQDKTGPKNTANGVGLGSQANHLSVRDTLTEIKQLPDSEFQTKLLRLIPPAVEKGTKSDLQKENHPACDSRPFSTVIDALKRMNDELGGNKPISTRADSQSDPEQFRLLQFPSRVEEEEPIKLPRVVVPPEPQPQLRQPYNASISDSAPVPWWNQNLLLRAGLNDRNSSDEYVMRLPHSIPGMSNVPVDSTLNDFPYPILQLKDSNTQRLPFFMVPEHVHDERFLIKEQHRVFLTAPQSPRLLKLDSEPLKSEEPPAAEKPTKNRKRVHRVDVEPKPAATVISKPAEELQLPINQASSDNEKGAMEEPVAKQPEKPLVELKSQYAFPLGMFDEYLLEEPERGSEMFSNAHIQYQAVKALQSQRQPTVLKKDMWTETNFVESADDLKRPDDQGQQTIEVQPVTSDQQLFNFDSPQLALVPVNGHAYLNVADISADVLDEVKLPSVERNQQSTGILAKPAVTNQTQSTAQSKVSFADLKPVGDVVTTEVFRNTHRPTRVTSNSNTNAVTSNAKKTQNQLMLAKLDSQFAAVAAIAQEIENNFHSTDLVVNTIDDVEDGDQTPVRSLSPEPETPIIRRVWVESSDSQRHPDMDSQEIDYMYQQKNKSGEMISGEIITEPVDFDENFQDHLTLESTQDHSAKTTDQWPSGLAAKLLDQALRATHEGKRLSKDDLKELYEALSPQATLSREVASTPRTEKSKEIERKQEIQEWMQRKREEMMKDFKARTANLRADEKRPYVPLIKTSTKQAIVDPAEAEKMRLARKQSTLNLRRQNASRLMHELLSEDLPSAPDLDSFNVPPPPRKIQPFPSSTRGKKENTTVTAKKAWTNRSERASDMLRDIYADYSKLLVEVDRDGTLVDEQLATSRNIRSRQIEGQVHQRSGTRKTFTDRVRTQRPDLLRSRREHTSQLVKARAKETPRVRVNESERKIKSGLQSLDTSRSFEPVGTQRLRAVKSYAERLRERNRNRNRPFSAPSGGQAITAQGQRPVVKAEHASHPKDSRTEPRRTMTYAEQLQSLQPPKDIYKKGATKSRSRPYGDPYSQSSIDQTSLLSSWSVDENVRRLLYDDSASDFLDTAGSRSFASIPKTDNYAAAVDVDDLHSIVSDFSEVSWSSYLDWNEVDRLVEENG